MNILNELTIKNLKLNKKRTIVTIIGIILSTALICAVAGMVSSFQATLVNFAIVENGNRHITINDVSLSDTKYFLNNPHVISSFTTENIGYAYLEESSNSFKPYVFITSLTKEALDGMSITVEAGRLPEKANEIIISKTIQTDAEIAWKIGDKIKLDIGSRVCRDGKVLNQSNPLFFKTEDDEVDDCQERLDYKFTKEYTIVGIMQRPNYTEESYVAPGYSAYTYQSTISTDSINVSLLFKDSSYYKEFISLLENDANFSQYSYTLNDQLLRFSGVSLSDNTLNMFYSVAGVVIIIIILTSIFVIKNSFDISITEKTKQYGMLSSIGATSKQIKRNILYEGFILGVIGIPIGILSGIFADFILVKVINIFGSYAFNDIEFVFKVPLLPILISVVLASITIFLSTIRVARRSSKIAPIEAIRSNNDIKIKNKKLKTPKIIAKLFGIGGEIAHKNLKRSRRKYRTTVISLVVSITTFIALSSFIDYGFRLTSDYYKDTSFNMVVRLYNRGKLPDRNVYNALTKLDNINSFNIASTAYYSILSNEYFSEEARKHIIYYEYENLEIVSLSEEEFKRYIKKIGGNYENYQDKGILFDDDRIYDSAANKYIHINRSKLNKGDTLNLYENEEIVTTITIAKRTDILPMGFEGTYGENGFVFVSEATMAKLNPTEAILYIDSSNSEKLEKDIKDYFVSNPEQKDYYLYNYESEIKAMRSIIILVSIFLYGFITVISLIGITNIFNTLTTNINLRRKEFAMLKSIGMTKKEFNRMIRLESILYSTKSLVIGIPLGLIGSFLIYLAFAQGNDMNYFVPYKAIIIAIIVVYLLVTMIMHFSIKKISKQNIIETIRNDNI